MMLNDLSDRSTSKTWQKHNKVASVTACCELKVHATILNINFYDTHTNIIQIFPAIQYLLTRSTLAMPAGQSDGHAHPHPLTNADPGYHQFRQYQ